MGLGVAREHIKQKIRDRATGKPNFGQRPSRLPPADGLKTTFQPVSRTMSKSNETARPR
jgi:hypothetical protein